MIINIQEIRNGSLLLEGKRCSKYICYISVVEDADFRRAFHVDFDGMDDQDCDPDELGWYYFIG